MSRDIGFHRGARFYREGRNDMFQFGIDPNNVIGPRLATKSDQRTYPGEWEAYQAAHDRPQLDHDGDGFPGGSLPRTDRPTHTDAPPKNKGGRPRKHPV